MTIKEAKSQLDYVNPYFKGFTIKLIDKTRGNPLGARVEMSLGNHRYIKFLSTSDNLLELCISCFRSISMAEGRIQGEILGKRIRSAEFRELLGINKED